MKRKNVVFILADQLRADVLSCYGGSAVETPHIDALCEHGRLYRRAISPHPMCVPARASLLTGENAVVNGTLDNENWLRPDRKQCGIQTWPEQLADVGYHTEAIGKMHFYPWDIHEGFQHRLIAEDKRHIHLHDDYAEYLEQHGFKREHGDALPGYHENKGATVSNIPAAHQIDRWVADRTVEFIENRDRTKPFAVMVGFPGPHCPYDPPQEYLDLVDPEKLGPFIPETAESRRLKPSFVSNNKLPWNSVDYAEFTPEQRRKVKTHYCALVKQIDDCVGDIVKSLKNRGIFDETILIFTSDHGDLMGDFGFVGKQYFYENSIRVPLLVRHPDDSESAVIEKPVSLTDLHSTLLEIAGIPRNAGNDSIPLPASDEAVTREYVFGAINYGFMLTNDEWKLCRYDEARGGDMLFNLKNDPQEQINLADNPDYFEIKNRLDNILTDRILKSTLRAHEEKRCTMLGDIGAGDFGLRGWQRAYPFSAKH